MRKIKRERYNTVVGTNSNKSIKSGKKLIDLFVFRIHCDVEPEHVVNYIKRDVNVEQFVKISHNDAQMQSFKVTVKSDDFETVMDQNFWPAGVRCRRFFSKNFGFHGNGSPSCGRRN